MWILKRKNFWIIFLCDLLLLAGCYYFAYLVRFEWSLDVGDRSQYLDTIFPLLMIKMSCFFLFDLYNGMWRYTGIRDLVNVIKASVAGTVIFVTYLVIAHHFTGFSRSVMLIDCVFTVVAIGGLRLVIRLYFQGDPEFIRDIIFWRRSMTDRKKVFIVGTGSLAEQLLREIAGAGCYHDYKVIGFIEDGVDYKGMKIHGVPIMGSLDDIEDLVVYYEITVILVALPEMSAGKINRIVECCAGQGVSIKVVPSLSKRIGGNVSDQLRDIKVEDLLERDPVHLDMNIVREDIQGKRVMVTGAGGSIGSELARQILGFNPETIFLFDNAETPLYRIDMELRNASKFSRIIPCIGDIRSSRGLDGIFRRYTPDLVYHAAAYKHVPMMELSPLDAANNNVLGTYKLASIACRHHVKKFVMISTDKAVRPTSVMGTTKRVAEMVVQTMNGNGTRFSVVRFGNVLGSNGSVVPLFESQISKGGPVTVTDSEVTRYFMTIPEAVMLVLQAGTMGQGGELFLLDMGKPVKIDDLARKMIRLAGYAPGRDIEIKYTGLRPGEKLYEELLIDGEGVVDTAYEKIKICNNVEGIDENVLYDGIEKLNLLVKDSMDQDAALDILYRLVPAFARNRSLFKIKKKRIGSSIVNPDEEHVVLKDGH